MDVSEQQQADLAAEIVTNLKSKPGALLPILHAIKAKLGFIPDSAIPIIAEHLQQTDAEIVGVISFYHQFKRKPQGKHRVQVCRAEACQARGARELEQYVQDRLGIALHETTSDGAVTLDPVYCLGNCACGPSVRIDDQVYGKVTAAKAKQLLERLTLAPAEVTS
ncbi:formate dehydrogenase subunit gamma [Neptunomonas sp. XY-337]|uniref:formate dehydrogenase subunit gamma n=1 Tax=Neptunomonas sp. XY-337 TaxID=2561897 RepID=UPI0010A99B02|nr:formate dehydrogenase subunit gamma [Neptunomonas sp. XY-337]